MLNQIRQCGECGGLGKIKQDNVKREDLELCDKCNGTGILLEDRLAEIVHEFCPEIKERRGDLAKMLAKVFELYSGKLDEVYKMGIADGKALNEKKDV